MRSPARARRCSFRRAGARCTGYSTPRAVGPGDPLLLNVGSADGVSVGTQFFTQREDASSNPASRTPALRVRQTSGWVRVVEVDEHSSLAVVERSCAEVRRGDQLTPLQWPAAVTTGPVGTFDYDDPATVLFGPEGRTMLGTSQFLVIDQGADREIVPGQRLTIFRASPRGPQEPVTRLGEAVAVLVESTSATIQVIQSREPIRRGDQAPSTGRPTAAAARTPAPESRRDGPFATAPLAL